jgi:hypothetical protein
MSYVPERRSLAVLALLPLLAACGTHTAAPSTNDAAARWHHLVVCGRTHGMPNLPDPQIDDHGMAHFPQNLKIPAQTRRACQAEYDRLAAEFENRPVTQAQLDGLLRFARCMRAHGVSDWPDPNASGQFPLDSRIRRTVKSAMHRPLTACEHYNPDPQGRIYGADG